MSDFETPVDRGVFARYLFATRSLWVSQQIAGRTFRAVRSGVRVEIFIPRSNTDLEPHSGGALAISGFGSSRVGEDPPIPVSLVRIAIEGTLSVPPPSIVNADPTHQAVAELTEFWHGNVPAAQDAVGVFTDWARVRCKQQDLFTARNAFAHKAQQPSNSASALVFAASRAFEWMDSLPTERSLL